MAVAGNFKIQWFARAEDTGNAGTYWSRGAAVDMIRGAGISSGGRCGPSSAAHEGALTLRRRSHLFNRGHSCTAAVAGEFICTNACRLKLDLNRHGRITGRCDRRAAETTPASRLCRGDRRHSLSSKCCGSARRGCAIKLRSDWTRKKQCGGGLSQEGGAEACRRLWHCSRECGGRITSARSKDFSNGFVNGDVLGNGIAVPPVHDRHWRRDGRWSHERPQTEGEKERSTAMERNRMKEENGFASRSWKVAALQRSGDGTRQEESAHVEKPVIMVPISSEEEFEAALAEGQRSKRAVIIEWMAQWCRKCIYLKPKLEKLALEYSKYKFYEVDVNNVPGSLVKRSGITKMPTIQLWKDGEKQAEVSGGSEAWVVIDKVKDMIRKG